MSGTFHNNPHSDRTKKITHQPLTGDHYGIHWSIQPDGDVVITSGLTGENEEYDQITVPNLFVFKLTSALRMTRTVSKVAPESNRPWKDKQYTHQPLTQEYFGITAQIKENGRIVLRTNETEYDEIEVPASLIFKLASALKMTQTVSYDSKEIK